MNFAFLADEKAPPDTQSSIRRGLLPPAVRLQRRRADDAGLIAQSGRRDHGHRALAAAPVDPAGSVDLLKAMRQSFGPYFAPEEMTPVGVGTWYDKHVGDAAVMMDTLVSLGLESQESADLVKEVANEPRA